MATLHSQFSSSQSQRYAAECNRLAGYSRNPKAAAKPAPTRKAGTSDSGWFGQIWSAPRHLATNKLAHR